MTNPVDLLLARAGAAPAGPAAGTPDREKLAKLAEEFESMLLVQMLREMRQSGKWEDESSEGRDVESLFDTLDVELATHLSHVQGIGLGRQLLDAFERMTGTSPAATDQAPASGPVPAPPATAAPARPAAAGVTSDFGWRRDPFTGTTRFHKGVDLRAAYGQDVLAVAPGTVVVTGEQGGYGTTVLLEHPDGTRSRYAHLSATAVRAGDVVAAGECIGRVGQSGRATGPHLHFELLTADGRATAPGRDGGIKALREVAD